MNVIFICNGNVCRSPLAAALLKKKYEDRGIDARVSSAGFESYNINEEATPQARKLAEQKGYKLDHRARIFMKSDFEEFDRIYVMDTRSYREVKDLARNKNDLEKIDYLMNVLEPGLNKTVPDPYMTGLEDIDTVFDLLDKATDRIAEMADKS